MSSACEHARGARSLIEISEVPEGLQLLLRLDRGLVATGKVGPPLAGEQLRILEEVPR